MHTEFGSEEPKERLAINEYGVPSGIWLEAGRVYAPRTNVYRFVQANNETFKQFVNLAAESDEEVWAFAKRWGLLFLCKKHLAPAGHNPYCEPLGDEGEPTDSWRLWAQQAQAILNISQRLDDDALGKIEDWKTLYDTGYGYGPLRLPWHDPAHRERYSELREAKKKLTEKQDIANLVNEWLAAGGVRPNIEWASRVPLITLAGHGLFGSLALHLLELSGRYVLAGCSECHKFYYPTRRPKATQRRYCPDCVKADIPLKRASHWRNLRKQALGATTKTKKR